jgi:HAD superfamily hydrolase (TIGR01509 family)
MNIIWDDFDGFIFDCDGTLADSMPLHFRAWTAAVEELSGAPSRFDEPFFYSLGGIPTRKVVEEINRERHYQLDPVHAARVKEKKFMELLPAVGPIRPVVTVVEKLGRGAPMAVASGGFKHVVEATLDRLGLRDYFRAVVTPEDVPRGKPAPDMFLKAADLLGVAPARCLVFEDGPPGFAAADAAGMRYVDVRAHYEPRS